MSKACRNCLVNTQAMWGVVNTPALVHAASWTGMWEPVGGHCQWEWVMGQDLLVLPVLRAVLFHLQGSRLYTTFPVGRREMHLFWTGVGTWGVCVCVCVCRGWA